MNCRCSVSRSAVSCARGAQNVAAPSQTATASRAALRTVLSPIGQLTLCYHKTRARRSAIVQWPYRVRDCPQCYEGFLKPHGARPTATLLPLQEPVVRLHCCSDDFVHHGRDVVVAGDAGYLAVARRAIPQRALLREMVVIRRLTIGAVTPLEHVTPNKAVGVVAPCALSH